MVATNCLAICCFIATVIPLINAKSLVRRDLGLDETWPGKRRIQFPSFPFGPNFPFNTQPTGSNLQFPQFQPLVMPAFPAMDFSSSNMNMNSNSNGNFVVMTSDQNGTTVVTGGNGQNSTSVFVPSGTSASGGTGGNAWNVNGGK